MDAIELVNCNGMYRSASTLCYIFMKELIERQPMRMQLLKKHNRIYPEANALNIYTYRDVRDVLRSFCIKYNSRLEGLKVDALT